MSESAAPAIVFALAHQDDEYGLNSRIRLDASRGAEIFVVYLTNGQVPRGVSPTIRNAECSRVLASYGVRPTNISFVGTEECIDVGNLVYNLDVAAARLREIIAPISSRIEAFYTLAWEGGHQDHDAAHLAALHVAAEEQLLSKCWEYSLYNGVGAPWPFHVMRPIPGKLVASRHLPVGEAWKSAVQCWRYRSQYRTWIGLFPEAFLRWLWFRRELISPVDVSRIDAAPHSGKLLYERMFGISYEEFARQSAGIRRQIQTASRCACRLGEEARK